MIGCVSTPRTGSAGTIERPNGEVVPGPEVCFIGRRHGRRADRRWARSWSPEQIHPKRVRSRSPPWPAGPDCQPARGSPRARGPSEGSGAADSACDWKLSWMRSRSARLASSTVIMRLVAL